MWLLTTPEYHTMQNDQRACSHVCALTHKHAHSHTRTHAHSCTCTVTRACTNIFPASLLNHLAWVFIPPQRDLMIFLNLPTPTVYKQLAKSTSAMHASLVGMDRGMGFASSLIPPFTLPLSSLKLQLQNYL